MNYLAAKLGRSAVTARMPIVRTPWYISSAKAQRMLEYKPKWMIFDMVDDAVAGI